MTTILKVRVVDVNSAHVKVNFFMGVEGHTLANIGELVFDSKRNDYQLFGSGLGLGSEQMQDHFKVQFEEKLHLEWLAKEGGNQ